MYQKKTMMKRGGLHRKIVLLLVLGIWCGTLSAFSQVLDTRFPAQLLTERLDKISEAGEVSITYDAGELGHVRVPALDARSLTVEQVLEQSLKTTNFTWKKIAAGSYTVVSRQLKSGKEGTVSGSVIDNGGFPIPGATVQIVGTSLGVATDVNGKFSLVLPAGRVYSIEVRCVSFRPIRISDVKVIAGRTTPLDVVLQEATEELGEVMVKASYKKASVESLYAKQKERVSMTDGVSADQIKRTSDNNVAQVLRRLPGVSLSDGKFVTIRGVSERYNNIYVNGASMPSTDPNRKNFAFDLIPTNMVESVVVAKTFTPDMSAEFAGGTVEVNTLSIPATAFLSLSAGTGFNTNTTGKPFISGKRFESDYFLGKSPTRYWFGRDWVLDWYKDMGGNLNKSYIHNLEGVNKMNAKIPNLWGLHKYTGKPTQAYSVTGGIPFQVGGHRLGIVAAASYRHEEKRESYGCDNMYDLDNVQWDKYNVTYIQRSHEYSFVTTIGAMANLGWEWRGQKLLFKNIFNNRYSFASMARNYRHDNYGQCVQTALRARRSQLIQTRLEGEHEIWRKRFTLNWFVDYNKLDREAPDERNLRGDRRNGETTEGEKAYVYWGNWAGTGPGTYDHIFTSDLNEIKKSVGVSIEIPFSVRENPQMIKTGWEANFRKAFFRQNLLQIDNIEMGTNREWGGPNMEDYAKPEHFLDSTLRYLPWGVNPNGDGYAGIMNIKSLYIMGQFAFLQNRINVTAGVRREETDFSSREIARNAWAGTEADSMKFDKTDWFPSFSVVGHVTDRIDARVSYAKTIARFDFREVANDEYNDIMTGIRQSGNDSLKFSYIDNADARFEWYPSAGEIVSLSFFYKKFKHPVENLVSTPTGNEYYGRPINLKEATGKGLELNFRKSLAFIARGTFLKNMYLSANGMYMKMNVNYDQKGNRRDSVRHRPLVDLVPWSVNGSLTWQGNIFGAAVNYGVTGRKLLQSAPSEEEDEYVAPRHLLDLQVSARLLKNRMEIKANASDILNQPEVHYMNSGFKGHGEVPRSQYDWRIARTDDMGYNRGKDFTMRRIKKGVTFSFSVGYKF